MLKSRKRIAYRMTSWILPMVLMIGFLSVHANGAKVRVNPLVIKTTLTPGEAVKKNLTVRSYSKSSVNIEIKKTDLAMNSSGETRYPGPGNSKRSIAPFMEVKNNEVTLEPEERREIPVTIHLPKSADKLPHWGRLLVSVSGSQESGSGININTNYGIFIFQHSPLLENKKGSLKSMNVNLPGPKEENNNNRINVSATFTNDCKKILWSNIDFVIKDKSGKTIVSKRKKDKVILPEQNRTFTAEFSKDSLNGRYLALAIIDYGGSKKVGAQYAFEVSQNKSE